MMQWLNGIIIKFNCLQTHYYPDKIRKLSGKSKIDLATVTISDLEECGSEEENLENFLFYL